jgi:AmmeMemoRadiSam system protein A
MSSLADGEKKFLLEVARRAVVAAVERRDFPESSADGLSVSGFVLSAESAGHPLRSAAGGFVTLHRGSRLRGCIGQLPGRDPLIRVVAHCARAAALEDPRFRPLSQEELSDIEIEISVLWALEDIAPQDIVAGKHGLLVSRGSDRGVLLPQVATQFNWTAEKFLEETCVKAGLDRQAWKDPQTRIQAFTAEVFRESDLAARELPKPGYSIST